MTTEQTGRQPPERWGPTEHQLLHAVLEGETFRPLASRPLIEANMTPVVRGDDLAAMLAGRYGSPSYRGFAALGLRIANAFELIDARLPPVRFVSCTFEGRFAIVESQLPRLTLVGCDLADGLSLRASTMTGRLTSRSGRIGGTTDLCGADIGDISVVATTFAPHSGVAIEARNLTVRQDARFTGRCRATATIDLTGASIGGTLSFASASITPPRGDALRLGLATVGNNLFLDNNFSATGPVDLEGATIAGRVCFATAQLTPVAGAALRGQAIDVGRDLSLNDNFRSTGTIDLANGRIGSLLSLQHASLEPHTSPALRAQNLRLTDGAFNRGFRSSDTIQLDGARIDGGLAFTDARLSAPDGVVISAQRVTVAHSARFDGRVTTSGLIDLTGARVDGDLDFAGARLGPPTGPAVTATNARVGQDLRFSDGFVSRGELRLDRVAIGGALVVEGASLKPHANSAGGAAGPSGSSEVVAVDLGDADLRSLRWKPTAVTATVSLAGATVGVLDDTPSSWMGYRFDLGGLNVDRLAGDGSAWHGTERLTWLTSANRIDQSSRQLRQFADLSDEHGDRDAAVALRREESRTASARARQLRSDRTPWSRAVRVLLLLVVLAFIVVLATEIYRALFA